MEKDKLIEMNFKIKDDIDKAFNEMAVLWLNHKIAESILNGSALEARILTTEWIKDCEKALLVGIKISNKALDEEMDKVKQSK